MSFGSDIASFGSKASSNMDLVVRRATFELSSMLVKDTAVDTGLLRSNWHLQQDKPPAGTQPIGAPPAIAQSQTLNAGHVAYLVNNLPYAMAIMEYGHSKQTPLASARTSVMQVQAMVASFVRGLP